MIEIKPQPVQLEFLQSKADIVFYGGGAGGGKVGANHCKIKTPFGDTTYKDISVGDLILNPDGSTQQVLAKYPHKNWDFYKVSFCDGSSTLVGLEHLWKVSIDCGDWEVITTEEIKYLLNKSNRIEIPVTNPLDFEPKIINNKSCISSSDYYNLGLDIADKSHFDYKYNGFGASVLYSSISNRLAVLHGILDLEAKPSHEVGYVSLITRNKKLSEGLEHLVQSLGGLVYTLDVGGSYWCKIILPSCFLPFTDKNKLRDFKQNTKLLTRKIISIEYATKCDGACISVSNPNKLYLTDNFIVTHNTWSILIDNLQGIHDPLYFSVFFRSTITEIDLGLWPEAVRLYTPYLKDKDGKFIGKANISKRDKIITFPSGARSKFAYMERDEHADAWYGSEITKIYYDEFQRRSQYQFDILLSRNRSMSFTPKGVRATLNPDRHHFVYEWIKYYLDEEGFPDKSLSGKLRYYYRINGELITGWDKEDLIKNYGVPNSQGNIDPPESYTYIPSTLDDNEELTKRDPKYRAKLNAMPERARKQLLLGCWADEEDFGQYCKRAWLVEIASNKCPKDCVWVRGYDLGYSAPSQDNPKPDFTAGIKIGKDRAGNVYIKGDFTESFKDDKTEVYGQFRKSIGDRDRVMLEQAQVDTKGTYIGLPREGAGGKEVYQHKVKMFTKEGYIVKQDPSPNNANKLKKFEAFSSYAESGLVFICKDSFPNNISYDNFLSSLERFNPTKNSTASYKDDIPDAVATAFNIVMTLKNIKIVSRKQLDATTYSSNLLQKR